MIVKTTRLSHDTVYHSYLSVVIIIGHFPRSRKIESRLTLFAMHLSPSDQHSKEFTTAFSVPRHRHFIRYRSKGDRQLKIDMLQNVHLCVQMTSLGRAFTIWIDGIHLITKTSNRWLIRNGS